MSKQKREEGLSDAEQTPAAASGESELARAMNEAQSVNKLGALHADAERLRRDIEQRENELGKRRREQYEKRQAFLAEQNRLETERLQALDAERTIPVIVQTRKDRDVRISSRIAIPCRVPVLVNRRELRKLEGLRATGRVQLIVGKIEKPGKISELGG